MTTQRMRTAALILAVTGLIAFSAIHQAIPAVTVTDYSYPNVPDWLKEQAWDQGHKYADGMEPQAYDKAQTDFFNGYVQCWINNNNFTVKTIKP